MAKTKTPFLSLGAHGSVGGSLTAQKRLSSTLVRQKPLPTDPYSLPQAYQRWLYEDYAYLWRQQSVASRQQYASAGVRFHLTGFQYWMKYNLSNLPGILAFWHLDEKAGSLCHDYGPNNIQGTIIGASPSTGVIDGSQYFDGINDYIDFTAAPNHSLIEFSDTNIWTFEHWINAKDAGRTIFYAGRNHSYECFQCQHTAAAFRYAIRDKNGTYRVFLADASPYLDIWTHLTWLAHGDGNMSLYVNGVLVLKQACLSQMSFDFLGRGYNAATYDLKGYLDHAILYDFLLDQTTITRHAQRRYGPSVPPTPPPTPTYFIGDDVIDRTEFLGDSVTFIVSANPATANFTIDTVLIWANANLSNCRVGTLYKTNGNDLKCRDSQVIGFVTAGSEQTFPGLSIDAQIGDYIGIIFTGGKIERTSPGEAGLWYKTGDFLDPGDEETYLWGSGFTISLRATGS